MVFSGCCKRFPCFLLALALTVIQCEESRQTNQRVHAIRGTGNMLVWEGFGVWKCFKGIYQKDLKPDNFGFYLFQIHT